MFSDAIPTSAITFDNGNIGDDLSPGGKSAVSMPMVYLIVGVVFIVSFLFIVFKVFYCLLSRYCGKQRQPTKFVERVDSEDTTLAPAIIVEKQFSISSDNYD